MRGGPAKTQALSSLKVCIVRSLGSELCRQCSFKRNLLARQTPSPSQCNRSRRKRRMEWDETPHGWDGRRKVGGGLPYAAPRFLSLLLAPPSQTGENSSQTRSRLLRSKLMLRRG